MSALGGTDLFDLHRICIMKSIIFYHIRIKIYSCLGICIFINLYMALSINVKNLRVIREVIFSQMHRSTMNWKCNHYWTMRPFILPFLKGQVKIIIFLHLAVGKFGNSLLSWIKAMLKRAVLTQEIFILLLIIIIAIIIYQDIKSIWNYYNI